MKNRYKDFRESILDKEFREQVSYEDLDHFMQVWNLIGEVHKERRSDDLGKIHLGLYQEMKRAIAQGHDYKSKSRMLRQFCNEACEQIMDNVEELMVVTNG